MQSKVVIEGKTERKSNKKHKIKKGEKTEIDIEIDVEEDGTYEVEKLSIEGLPAEIDGQPITWFNNFAIKKGGNYINQRYKVKIPGLGKKRVVIIDNNSHGAPYFYTGPTDNDEIVLSDGDPAIGTTD